MNQLKILNNNEKKEIVKKLNEQFGINEISGIITRMGKERLFLFSGSFNNNEISKLEKIVNIERVGVYFAKLVPDENKIRLNIEGTQLLKDQIKKNIFELKSEQVEQWMRGQELNIKTGKKDFLVMKFGGDFLGCGKASAEKISNFIPKSRRLK